MTERERVRGLIQSRNMIIAAHAGWWLTGLSLFMGSDRRVVTPHNRNARKRVTNEPRGEHA